jgi:hypothetical protein
MRLNNQIAVIIISSTVLSVHAMKTYEGVEAQLLTFLTLALKWSWVVKFKTWSLYAWGKNPWHQLNRKLGGAQRQSGHFGEEKLFASARNQTMIPQLSRL